MEREGVRMGGVRDKPQRLRRHQRAQAHNSTLYRRQHSFMYWLCSKQNCLLCAYERDFGDNDIISIVYTGLTSAKICSSFVSIKSSFRFRNHLIRWRMQIQVYKVATKMHNLKNGLPGDFDFHSYI
jgi:hypothetical protein